MPTAKDYVGVEMIAAVAAILTPITVLIFIAFLSQSKKGGLKAPATICLLSSVVGTSLGWVGLVGISKFQDELSCLRFSMKLVLLGTAFVAYPIVLFPKWFGYWVASILKRQPAEQRALFHIGGIRIELFDILRLLFIVISVLAFVQLWRLASI